MTAEEYYCCVCKTPMTRQEARAHTCCPQGNVCPRWEAELRLIRAGLSDDSPASKEASANAAWGAVERLRSELSALNGASAHLEEGARLLSSVSRTMSFMRAIEATATDLLSEDLVAWQRAERARIAISQTGAAAKAQT